MAIRKVLTKEEDILKKISRPVTDFNEKLFLLLEDMRDTLTDHEGAGLAAVQIGILRRVLIIEIENLYEIINPQLLSCEGEQTGLEGCLSIPGIKATVTRPEKVTVKYQDRTGKEVIQTFEGFEARAICHELDHLEGILYLTRALEGSVEEIKDDEESEKGGDESV
jgi:peptide deformylase